MRLLSLLTTALVLGHAPDGATEPLREEQQPVSSRWRHNMDEQHDRGGMFRLEIGAGYASRWNSTLGEDGGVEAKGIGVPIALAVGWLPFEQFAVHASTWGLVGRGTHLLAAGPGVTYWLAPQGPWFVSGALGFTLHQPDGLLQQITVAAEIELGLFAWLSDHADMGLSLVAAGEALDIDGDGSTHQGWRIGFRLGVGFN